jgi:eukaryotic-like serine/threonine-protein kinase
MTRADRGLQAIGGGRYRLERDLGHGGMASVYFGRDSELERPVAVKVLSEALAADDGFRRRFEREARLAARLSHPNLVGVYDVGVDEGRPFIVLEYVEGETLAALLSRRGRLEPDEARGLALQAARALAAVHEAELVHRDVKPQNLILRDDGTLKLADFGIATAREVTALTQAGTILGTAAYLAPEQALGEEVSLAADVYSLGAVLYELLAGRPPFTVETLAELAEKQRRGEIEPVGDVAPAVPADLEDAVMRCLARVPTYRPTAAQLTTDLSTTRPLARPAPKRRAEPTRRRLWIALAAVLVVAAILLGVALATSDGHSTKPPRTPPARTEAIPHGSTPQQQAANIAAWLRARSGR